MQNRYRMYRRHKEMFYAKDRITGKAESLGTSDKTTARQLITAKNQAVAQPHLNRAMARTYLLAKSPELVTRTWTDVMDHYVKSGVESTRERKERAFKSRPFASLRITSLLDTEAGHLFAVLEHRRAGNSTHHYLRRLHNYALHLGWLLVPVMADAAWPVLRYRKFNALTQEEHEKIIAREKNDERRLYYRMLWETGGSQSDVANLHCSQIDLEAKTIHFQRQKLAGKDAGATELYIGSRLRALLSELPREGFLFPNLRLQPAKNRAAYFRKACIACAIEGKSLHSYRYAWAQRARAAGMPEREAMNHLGHQSRAIHSAYGRGARVAVLPLEHYEEMRQQKIAAFAGN